MPNSPIHQCDCSICKQQGVNSTQEMHATLNYVLSTLDEQQQRLIVGLEVKRRGPGCEPLLSQITGWSEAAIAVAVQQLEQAAFPKKAEEEKQEVSAKEKQMVLDHKK